MIYPHIHFMYRGAKFFFAVDDGKRELVAAAVLGQWRHVQVCSYLCRLFNMFCLEYLVILYRIKDIAGGYLVGRCDDRYVVFCRKCSQVIFTAELFAGLSQHSCDFDTQLVLRLQQPVEALVAYGLGAEEDHFFTYHAVKINVLNLDFIFVTRNQCLQDVY